MLTKTLPREKFDGWFAKLGIKEAWEAWEEVIFGTKKMTVEVTDLRSQEEQREMIKEWFKVRTNEPELKIPGSG